MSFKHGIIYLYSSCLFSALSVLLAADEATRPKSSSFSFTLKHQKSLAQQFISAAAGVGFTPKKAAKPLPNGGREKSLIAWSPPLACGQIFSFSL